MPLKIKQRGSVGGLEWRMRRGAISKKRILLPRPFLGPALDQVIASGLGERVRAAIQSGLKFQRGKN
jgi:hypothetical protein